MRQVANEMAAKKNSGSVMADNTMMKHKLSKQVGCGGVSAGALQLCCHEAAHLLRASPPPSELAAPCCTCV